MFAERGLPDYSETSIELLGTETTYGPHGKGDQCREVVVKIATAHPKKEALVLFSREIAQAATGMGAWHHRYCRRSANRVAEDSFVFLSGTEIGGGGFGGSGK